MGKQKIIGIVILAFGILGLVIGLTEGGAQGFEAIPPGIIFSLIGLFLIIIIKRQKTQEEKEERRKTIERNKRTIYGEHLSGLPLSEGSGCRLQFDYDDAKIIITGGGHTFNLSFNKITDINIKTDAEIQKQYVSSIGGAVGGAVLFGPLGAMIGGRAKEKKSVKTTSYLIITYLKDEEINYTGFDVTSDAYRARNLIKNVPTSTLASGQTIDL